MRPGYIALIFWFFAACATFGIIDSMRTGITHSESATFQRDEEPVRFMMVILGKVFFIALAIAETYEETTAHGPCHKLPAVPQVRFRV